jgi:hypothetical protein
MHSARDAVVSVEDAPASRTLPRAELQGVSVVPPPGATQPLAMALNELGRARGDVREIDPFQQEGTA